MPPPPKPRRCCPWFGSIDIAFSRECGLQLPYEAEAEPRIGGVAVRRQAPRRTHLRRRAQPRAAADHALAATRVDPGLAVGRRAAVAFVPAVGHPLADVAGQVVKAECIRCESPCRREPPVAVAIACEGVMPLAASGRTVESAGH